ncbi:TafC family fimbrial protein [Haloarcula sp. H-GB5]
MSKKWTRRSALALIGSGAGLLTWGTGGFTDVTADRQVNIDTTEDSSDGPLLGITSLGDGGSPGQTVSLITLQNNLGEEVSDIVLEDASVGSIALADIFKGERVSPSNYFDTPNSIAPGEQGAIKATLDLLPNVSIGSDREYDVTLDFTASTANQEVTVERESTVKYEDPRVSYWDFDKIGLGNPSVPDSWGNSGASRLPNYWPSLRLSRQRRRVLYFSGNSNQEDFSGNSNRGDVVRIFDSSKLDFIEGDEFSLSVWIKPYSIPNSYARLFSKWNSAIESGYQFFLTRHSRSGFEIGIETGQQDGKTNVINTGATVSQSRWNHVVWTHRSSESSGDKVYVNGVKEHESDLEDPFGSNEPLRLGNGINASGILSFPFNGRMDEPKVYDTALTDEWVENLYNTSKGGDGGSIGG